MINLRLKKLEGYTKFENENKYDFCRKITTWIIIISVLILPIINLILGVGVYIMSEEVYQEFKNKIEVYNK